MGQDLVDSIWIIQKDKDEKGAKNVNNQVFWSMNKLEEIQSSLKLFIQIKEGKTYYIVW